MSSKVKKSKSDVKPKKRSSKKELELSDISSSGGAGEEIVKSEPIDKSTVPVIVELPKLETNIFDTDQTVIFSTNIDYPRSEYGFHHFIHNNKNKTEKLKVFEGKKRVYLVFNIYERNIDNYDKSINNTSKIFFGTGDKTGEKPEILNRGFYKLWEILMMFNLIDTTQDKFVSAHLSEETGAYVQATMFYRDTYCKKNVSKNDKYYAVTTHPDDIGGKNNIREPEKAFMDYYQKEKPQRFIPHQTYPKKQSGGSKSKDNGDITDPKTLKLFGGQMEEKADLITGEASLRWVNDNIQEQEAYRLLIAQVVATAKLQKKGGSFVCKFFETFTKTSLKIVSMLTVLYQKIYWVKPLTSRLLNSEKYLVCVGFKFSEKDKEYKDIIKKMDELLKSTHEDKTNKIVDIFPNYEIPKNLIRTMIELNTEISNPQLKSIGEIISFVDKEIYSGDEYHDKRGEQIKGAQFWNSTFLPEPENLNKSKKICESIIQYALDKSTKEISKLNKLLAHVENQV